MKTTAALRGRAVFALLLMVGFYLLALGLAGALLSVPVLEWSAGRVHLRLDLFALIAGVTILWAIFPRRERFEAPGPRLRAAEHPQLFEEIERVARATGQRAPDEVYLVPDVNAWVTERSAPFGLRRVRVMGLGLALMRLLNVSEFRAVLAHEFGHYHGGDTRLGVWLFGARVSMGRTVKSLSAQSSWLHLPFLWYGNAFLRVTHALSRQQEFVADALAARTVSPAALGEGLKRVHGGGLAFDGYWSSELAPALKSGVHPPIADGFARFLRVPALAAVLEERVAQAVQGGQTDPLDTHPPLHERLAAIAPIPPGEASVDDRDALSLLTHPLQVERALLRHLAGTDADALEGAAWEDVGERVYRPLWARVVHDHAAALAPLTARRLPALLSNPAALNDLAVALGVPEGEERPGRVRWILAAGVGGVLAGAGAAVTSLPGEPVRLEAAGWSFDPHAFVAACLQGEAAAGPYLAELQAAGVADTSLAADSPHES
ncbi:M48 family metallopeptidase [Deinococcus sonorensis]|uniref:M48 family metallopeptidase n=2 Tax=Deinococcus sonorensis TaxID=309891 RepID=A0AAU7U548_9DEIO